MGHKQNREKRQHGRVYSVRMDDCLCGQRSCGLLSVPRGVAPCPSHLVNMERAPAAHGQCPCALPSREPQKLPGMQTQLNSPSLSSEAEMRDGPLKRNTSCGSRFMSVENLLLVGFCYPRP